MNDRYIKLTKKIIKENQYLSLATIAKGDTWSSTVTYVYDNNFNLYFMSEPSSKHIKDIKINHRISATIYDSQQKWGYGLGLQIVRVVEKVHTLKVPEVAKIFFARNYPYGGVPKINNIFKQAIEDKVYFFYKLIPQEIWVTDPEADVDGRILIQL